MARRRVAIACFLLTSSLAGAQQSWYAIEGFFLEVPEGYRITARDPEVRQVSIAPEPAGYGRGVWAFLVPARSNADLYVEVIEAFSLLYGDPRLNARPGELPPLPSITVTATPSVEGRNGFEIVATNDTTQAWFHAIRLGDTPGGDSGYLLLAPEIPGPEGQAALTTILGILGLRITNAAG